MPVADLQRVSSASSLDTTSDKQIRLCIPSVMAALQSPKLSVGVQIPGGTPRFKCESDGMVYIEDLKSSDESHAGSSPASRTNYKEKLYVNTKRNNRQGIR